MTVKEADKGASAKIPITLIGYKTKVPEVIDLTRNTDGSYNLLLKKTASSFIKVEQKST